MRLLISLFSFHLIHSLRIGLTALDEKDENFLARESEVHKLGPTIIGLSSLHAAIVDEPAWVEAFLKCRLEEEPNISPHYKVATIINDDETEHKHLVSDIGAQIVPKTAESSLRIVAYCANGSTLDIPLELEKDSILKEASAPLNMVLGDAPPPDGFPKALADHGDLPSKSYIIEFDYGEISDREKFAEAVAASDDRVIPVKGVWIIYTEHMGELPAQRFHYPFKKLYPIDRSYFKTHKGTPDTFSAVKINWGATP